MLTPDVFGALRATRIDRTGEIQLTNGLRRLLEERPLYACEVRGVRHDTGSKIGYLRAVVHFALRRPDLSGPFLEYLRSLDLLNRLRFVAGAAAAASRPQAGRVPSPTRRRGLSVP